MDCLILIIMLIVPFVINRKCEIEDNRRKRMLRKLKPYSLDAIKENGYEVYRHSNFDYELRKVS